jgi:uncharacterized protein YbjT (DUF2867 family)
MSSNTILVSGAAGGRQGSTGNSLVHFLRERGESVRAFVHKQDERSEKLRTLGAEIVVGDLLSLQSVRIAMTDIRRAYFAYPVQDGLLEATINFASAARDAGVELVVNLSQLLQEQGEQPTPHQKRHWLSEQVFNWAAVGVVHLDATVFYENLRGLTRGSLVRSGSIALPWGPESTMVPMIAAEDVARVAAGVLTGPAMPNGTVMPLIGTVVTNQDIANAFTELLGRRIPYHEITDEEWVQNVAGAGINPAALEHLAHLWRQLRTVPRAVQDRYFVSDAIERIGGTPPKSLSQFLHEQKHVFSFGTAAAVA